MKVRHSGPDGRNFTRCKHRRAGVCVCTWSIGILMIGAAVNGRGLSAFLQRETHASVGLPRRAAALGVVFGTGVVTSAGAPAHAFKNRVVPLKNEAKSPGKKPDYLGAIPRKEGALPDLAGCGETFNCFSSAATSDSNPVRYTPLTEKAHYVEPWRFSKGGAAKAFEDLQEVVQAYQPGQRGIDGGGFEIQEANPELRYLYVQFESAKKGYKDDVEFLVRADASGDGGEVRVRSASRQGRKDLGVNAKRLNNIVEALSKLDGWSAPLLTNQLFPDYIRTNSDSSDTGSGPKMMAKDKSLVSMLKDSR